MGKSVIILTLLILCSCTAGINYKNVEYGNLFHDDNSKVWLINKVVFNGAVISSSSHLDKDVIVFHDNGICDLIPFKNLGTGTPKKGRFYVNSKLKQLNIDFPKETWVYGMSYAFEDSISLKPNKESDYQMGMQLKPFMEL